MDRNLALEVVRVTEAAALSSARWMGLGNAQAPEQAAVVAEYARMVEEFRVSTFAQELGTAFPVSARRLSESKSCA